MKTKWTEKAETNKEYNVALKIINATVQFVTSELVFTMHIVDQ